MLAATFLLIVLLIETGKHYARTVHMIELESAKSQGGMVPVGPG